MIVDLIGLVRLDFRELPRRRRMRRRHFFAATLPKQRDVHRARYCTDGLVRAPCERAVDNTPYVRRESRRAMSAARLVRFARPLFRRTGGTTAANAMIMTLLTVLLLAASQATTNEAIRLATLFRQQVDHQINLPVAEQHHYATLLEQAMTKAELGDVPAQYFVLVDRNPFVQAVMLYWKSESGEFHFIGASQASTGQPGRFEHFETPLGVFQHTLENLDFRAEGTPNEFGILGYGRKGMRVYDFGWVKAPKGWGDGRQSVMRLQLHSTDPDLLEPRLGSIQSKGCIRVPASLNTLIDHYGILDAPYERAMEAGESFWVLPPDREATPWSGEFLVVIDSERDKRPSWSPAPRRR